MSELDDAVRSEEQLAAELRGYREVIERARLLPRVFAVAVLQGLVTAAGSALGPGGSVVSAVVSRGVARLASNALARLDGAPSQVMNE